MLSSFLLPSNLLYVIRSRISVGAARGMNFHNLTARYLDKSRSPTTLPLAGNLRSPKTGATMADALALIRLRCLEQILSCFQPEYNGHMCNHDHRNDRIGRYQALSPSNNCPA